VTCWPARRPFPMTEFDSQTLGSNRDARARSSTPACYVLLRQLQSRGEGEEARTKAASMLAFVQYLDRKQSAARYGANHDQGERPSGIAGGMCC